MLYKDSLTKVHQHKEAIRAALEKPPMNSGRGSRTANVELDLQCSSVASSSAAASRG